MLRRQKMMLALLAEAKQLVTQTVFVKLAFLLRHETAQRDDSAYYDFVPYKYGPFSFALYRELEALKRDGYVSWTDDGLKLASRTRREALDKIRELPEATRHATASIWRKYGQVKQRALLRDVYARYPRYASRSELHDLRGEVSSEQDEAPPAVYTAGYEQMSVDAFFDKLLRAGIRVIIDVRANPVSRKYGFARSSMGGIAEKLGLGYEHLPQLGIPSAARIGLGTTVSYQELLGAYESQVLPRQGASVKELAARMAQTSCVLVCVERDVECCHRSRLAEAVSRVGGLPVHHL